MTVSGKLVHVVRTAPDNSLAQDVVGVAWAVAGMGINEVETSNTYLLEPESLADREKVRRLLFTREELEECANSLVDRADSEVG